MTASKYWGEERHADAVYAVMLKKVRYVPPSDYEGVPPIAQPTTADGATAMATDHLQWETIRERVIKAGTVPKLVESLIDADGQMDSRQFNVFFATYRAFSTAAEVFRLITDLYTKNDWSAGEDVDEIRRSLRAVLMCWLEMYPEDFYEQKQSTQPPPQQNRHNANNSNHCASAAVSSPPSQLHFFPTLDALVDFARAHALHDLKQKGKRVRERLRRVAQNGGLSAQLPSIGRYSFAITGYDPNNEVTTTSPLRSSADAAVDADERYARALASAQQRAQMFDTGTDNVPQIAEQLTLWDALFFRELRPYQCQGAIWGRRHKTGNGPVYSVRATIDQFNAVSERVMTSIVLPECRADQRARIVEKWVEVARELRALRNFSALKATISALQSEPVFRLKQCWAQVSKRHLALLNELRSIFELDPGDSGGGGGGGAKQKARHILETEGTAKLSTAAKIGGGLMNGGMGGEACRRTKSDLNLAMADAGEPFCQPYQQQQGTVPWLGTFLTDLEKLDQLYPDMTPDGLHNFEKRRKEFEVLAEIRLFQSAARSYTIQLDQAFCVWFHFLPALNEKECFARSLELEPLQINNNISSNNYNNNNSSSATSTPEEVAAVRRRGVRDGLNMHSLGRFLTAFSTAGGFSKDLDNGSPQRQLHQQFSTDGIGSTNNANAAALHQHRQSYSGGRRGSVCGASITDNASFSGVGIDLVDGGSASFCSGISSSAAAGVAAGSVATPTGAAFGASFEKKPPRSGAIAAGGTGRSQSQGAKKAHRAAASASRRSGAGTAGLPNCGSGGGSTAPAPTRRGNASLSPARSVTMGGGSVPPPSTLHQHVPTGNNYCCHHRHRLSQQPPGAPSSPLNTAVSQCGSEFSTQQQLLMFPSSSSVLSSAPSSSARFVATPPKSAPFRRPPTNAYSTTATSSSSLATAAVAGVEFGRQPRGAAVAASFCSSSAGVADSAQSPAAHFGTVSVQHSSSQGSSFNSSASRFATAAPTPPPKCRNSAAASSAAAGGMMMSPLTSCVGVEQNGCAVATALRRSHNESTGSSAGGGLRRIQQQQFSQKSISSTSSRSSMGALSSGGSKVFGGASPSSVSMSNGPREEQNFHLIRVGFDDTLQGELINAATINYKCIKVENGDRMPQLIERALDKHLMDPTEAPTYCLVQLLPDGNEFVFPDHCNPFYAVAPDPSSPMLACVLRKRRGAGGGAGAAALDNAGLAAVLNCSSGSTRSAAAMLAAQQQQQQNNGAVGGGGTSSALAKKLNKQKRNNLLRWSSGFL